MITHTRVTINGSSSARSGPGQTVRIAAAVEPTASGPLVFTVERFDPLAGWQFYRELKATAAGGAAGVALTVPAEGRWRARAAFTGTQIAAPSGSGFASLMVV